MVCRKGDGRTWKPLDRSMLLAIVKENDYEYKNHEDDRQGNCGRDSNSCCGPSLDDRHCGLVVTLISKAQSAGSGPEPFGVALSWR